MSKNSKQDSAKLKEAQKEAPVVNEETTVAMEETTVTTEETVVTEAPESVIEAPEVKVEKSEVTKAKVTVSDNLPKTNGTLANNTATNNSLYVKQLTSATDTFIKVAKDKNHSVELFNRTKVAMANSLSAAIKYEDGNEFVGSMNAFLKLVREHRGTAFHESVFNMYVPWLDMSHIRTIELSRVMSVFQQLASNESKTISKDVDFNTVFPTSKDERIVGRFRNWAIRQA